MSENIKKMNNLMFVEGVFLRVTVILVVMFAYVRNKETTLTVIILGVLLVISVSLLVIFLLFDQKLEKRILKGYSKISLKNCYQLIGSDTNYYYKPETDGTVTIVALQAEKVFSYNIAREEFNELFC